MKWVLRYVKDTIDFGLLFDANVSNVKSLVDYVDYNYG